MNKDKIIKFLEDSETSSWADEMTSIFYSDHKINNLEKWNNEIFSCVSLSNMVKSGELDSDVRQFLIDSSNGSTWADMMTEAWLDVEDDREPILSCETLLSFFKVKK